jgi:hypothetical protein
MISDVFSDLRVEAGNLTENHQIGDVYIFMHVYV